MHSTSLLTHHALLAELDLGSSSWVALMAILLGIVIASLFFANLKISALNERLTELERKSKTSESPARAQVSATVQPVTSAAPTPDTPRQTQEGEMAPEHLLAVISAAVHCAVGARARIVQLTNTEEAMTWSLEGRRAIFSGRRVR